MTQLSPEPAAPRRPVNEDGSCPSGGAGGDKPDYERFRIRVSAYDRPLSCFEVTGLTAHAIRNALPPGAAMHVLAMAARIDPAEPGGAA